ncbi:MAG: hypothetical protein WD894_09145 [Pirellulales bacterium]
MAFRFRLLIFNIQGVMMRACLIAAILVIAQCAWADVDSGPTPGEKVPPLKVLAVVVDGETKESENKETQADLSKERAEKPTLYLFVRADRFTRPVARTMKTLDQEVDKLGGETKLVAVWLTDDKQKTKDYLPTAQRVLDFDATTLALHPDLTTGPEHWGINSDADLTVVVTGDKKVAARFGFVAPNERVTRQVLAELKKVAKKKP